MGLDLPAALTMVLRWAFGLAGAIGLVVVVAWSSDQVREWGNNRLQRRRREEQLIETRPDQPADAERQRR